jgi:uncharacterized protein
LRFADRRESALLEGPLEILSLTGTLSPDGVHLHMSVSDRDGHTVGGHVGEGTFVYTTAEIVLVEFSDVTFSREADPETTFRELVIRPNLSRGSSFILDPPTFQRSRNA